MCEYKRLLCILFTILASVRALNPRPVEELTVQQIDPVTGNLTLFKRFELPFTGSEADFSETDLQVGDYFFDISCSVKANVECSLDSFTPADRRYFVHRTCVVENAQLLNTSEIPADTPFPDNSIHSRRRLLAVGPLLLAGWVGMGVGSIVRGESPVCGMSFGLFGCKESDSGPSPNPEQIAQLESLNRYIEGQLKWKGIQLEGLTNQQRINLGFQAVQENQEKQLGILKGDIDTLRQSDLLLANRIDSNRNETIKLMNDLYDVLELGLSGNQDYTDAKVQQLANVVFHDFRVLVNATRDAAANITLNAELALRRDRRIQRQVRTLTAAQYRQNLEKDVYRAMSKGIWRLIDRAIEMGYTHVYKHPDSPGSRPVEFKDIAQFDKQAVIDDILINMINKTTPSSSIAQARQLRVHVYARADVMIDNQGIDATFEDLFDMMGPAGCIANATADGVPIVERCNAWIEITHKRCRPKNNFHWADISSDPNKAFDRAAYVLDSDICFNGVNPVNDVWHNRKFDTHQAWLELFKPLSCYPLLSAVPAHKWQIVSMRAGIWNLAPPLTNDVCQFDVNRLFESSDFAGSVPFTVYATLRNNYAAFLLDKLPFENIRHGVPPNWIDHATKPFLQTSGGQMYKCIESGFVAVKPETVPVHVCSHVNTIPVCTSTAYNRPVVCPSCTEPRVAVSVQTTSDVTVTLAKPKSLPEASDVIFGELTGTGLDSVYDVPRKQSGPILPSGDLRRFTVPYLRIPVPEDFDYPSAVSFPQDTGDLKLWFELYGPEFEHRAASASLDLFVREITPSGRCVQVGEVQFQWLCRMLEDYTIHSSTDMRSGLLVLTPKEFRIDGRISVMGGKVIRRVFDGCPEFKYIQYTDHTVDIQIINSLPFPLTLLYRKRATLCTFGDRTLHIEAFKHFQEDVDPCGNMTVEIFSTGPDGKQVACQETPKQVIVNPLSETALPRALVGGFNQTFIIDVVGTGLKHLEQQLTETINGIGEIVPILLDPDLTLPDKLSTVNSTLKDVLDRIKDLSDALDLTQGSAVGDLADNNKRLIADVHRLDALQEENAALLSAQNATIAVQAAILANLTLAFAEQVALTADLKAKNDALIAALKARIDSDEDCTNSLFSGWNTSCGIGYIFTKVIMLVLFGLGVGILIYVGAKYVLPAVSKGISKSRRASRGSGSKSRRGSFSSVPDGDEEEGPLPNRSMNALSTARNTGNHGRFKNMRVVAT